MGFSLSISAISISWAAENWLVPPGTLLGTAHSWLLEESSSSTVEYPWDPWESMKSGGGGAGLPIRSGEAAGGGGGGGVAAAGGEVAAAGGGVAAVGGGV